MLVDPSGTDSYIFYVNDNFRIFGVLMDYITLMLSDRCLPWQVHLVSVSNYDDFKSEWNKMNGDIQTVIISSHGDPTRLCWQDYSLIVDSSGASKLTPKNIARIIITGCNAGHLDYEKTNVPAAFAKLQYGSSTKVIASDGTVTNWPIPRILGSANNEIFKGYLTKGDRDNKGWMIYTSADGKNVTTKSLSSKKSLSMSEMLRLI